MPSLRTALALHHALLWAGALCGLLVAYGVFRIPMDFSTELRQAHSLGIVSLTTLGGYPKSRDILTYATLFAAPFVLAFGFWLLGMRAERKTLHTQYWNTELEGAARFNRNHWIGLFLALTVFGAVSGFNINLLTAPGHNSSVGSWITLGEEGENLAWTQSLLNGGRFGKEFFCLYGPMLVEPIAWLMRIFGENMVVQRAYGLGLDFGSMVLMLALLAGLLRSLPLYAATALFWLFIFSPLTHLSPNTTFLRVTLAFLPLYALFRHSQTPTARSLLLWAGLGLGQSLLFSQEAGLCALLASVAMLVAQSRQPGRTLWREATLLLATTLLSMAPMLLHLAWQGALTATLATLYEYPKLVTLGYGSMPFPSIANWLHDPLGQATFPYIAPILFYVYAALRIATRLWLLGPQPRLVLQGGVLLFGLLLFRSALGRSDLYHLNFVLPPAFLLLLLFLDDALHALRQSSQSWARWLRGSELLLLALAALFYTSLNSGLRYAAGLTYADLHAPLGKWQMVESGVKLPQLERGGIYFHPATARSIQQIHTFLNANTREGEAVYFFPNEAAYYFLFNRSNPTRYAIAYFAVTSAQRNELIAQLEASKPRFVVYSLRTWRVDGIQESTQVPEVTTYILQKYGIAERFDGVTILRRKE